jgi:Flp pilus assembly protein TadG
MIFQIVSLADEEGAGAACLPAEEAFMRFQIGRPNRLRLFKADARGVVAIEFALVGILSVGLVLEALQGGLYMYQRSEIERVTALAARQVMIGAVANAGLTAAQFVQQDVCATLSVGMPCANLTVDLETVSEAASPGGFYAFANAGMSGPVPMPTGGAFCAGSPGSVMYLRVQYRNQAISPAWRAVASTTGITLNGAPAYAVMSYAAFRNEPFVGGGAGC